MQFIQKKKNNDNNNKTKQNVLHSWMNKKK